MLSYRSAYGSALLALTSLALGAACATGDGGDTFKDLSPSAVDLEGAADLRTTSKTDGATADLAPAGVDLPPPGIPILYPPGRTHSPITPSVVDNLRAIAALATAHEDVFAKVGDSHTVATGYMQCFNNASLDLAGFTDLLDGIEHFANGDAAGDDPYDRASLAALGGKTASWAISGSPSPVDQELAAISPRYATVMFGTNEIGSDNPTLAQEGIRAASYGGNMMTLIEKIIEAGAIPIISAIPPRTDVESDRMVPVFNAVARAIAQWKQVPFIDLELELRPLMDPKYGLASDGVHLQSPSAGACVFTAAGLEYGNNVRNLATMETLDLLKGILFDNDPAPDSTAPTLAGTGDRNDPFVIDVTALPFGDVRNTAAGGFDLIDKYTGCSATQDESGTEFWYRIELTEPTKLRALVLDRGAVDIDVHVLDSTGEASGCIARDDTQVVTPVLAAGTYFVVLDTFVKTGVAQSGEYLFVLLKEP